LQGCQTIFHCSTADESTLKSGKFYRQEKISDEIESFLGKVCDEQKREKLFEKSLESVKEFLN
jgi:hypothetical protein